MRRLVMAVIVTVALAPAYAAAADTIEGELVTVMCVAKNAEKVIATGKISADQSNNSDKVIEAATIVRARN